MRGGAQKLLPLRGITPGILAVVVTTFLVAVSTGALYSLSPFYLKAVGISVAAIGGIQSTAEAIAQACKLFSGIIGDYLNRNKPMLLLGTFLSAIANPIFIFADALWLAVTSKICDRIGNGLSSTPRDVYTAQHSSPENKGTSIALVMTFKTLGCVLGPWIVMAVFNYVGSGEIPYKSMIAFLSFPSFLAIFVCLFGMKEGRRAKIKGKPDEKAAQHKAQTANEKGRSSGGKKFFDIKAVSSLSKSFWLFIFIMSIFTFARAPEAYMLLGLHETGLPLWFCSGVIGFFNLISTLVSLPAGRLSDKFGRSTVLVFSFAALTVSLLCLSFPSKMLGVIGVVFWGVQRSTSQILSVACIADIVPARILGTAIGLLNLSASAVGIANAFAYGAIEKKYDFYTVYTIAAVCSFVALTAMFAFYKANKSSSTC
ncbi:MAG: MFS transporter [Holosporales bacterium]|jgi:MFS family permease|nr:MFS transporter [Holosporales bacterium]